MKTITDSSDIVNPGRPSCLHYASLSLNLNHRTPLSNRSLSGTPLRLSPQRGYASGMDAVERHKERPAHRRIEVVGNWEI